MTTLQTLSHTEVLQCDADTVWQAFQQASSILCNLIPEVFADCEYVKGHGEPGSIRILTLGPGKWTLLRLGTVSGEIFFWALSVDILVFPSPTGYTLTSFGFPLLNWGIFFKVLKNDR